MRDFNDKDRKKKSSRIQLGDNPANLSGETLGLLESAIRDALKDGYLSCPTAWKIAHDMGIPKIAIGPVMDRQGTRIANCQLGFFRVDKSPYDANSEPSEEAKTALRDLNAAGKLNCAEIFELAKNLKTQPIQLSNAASALGLKIRNCQLGCF
jgi:hypothetical protein